MPLTTAQQLAVAVLQGDEVAERALVDALLERYKEDYKAGSPSVAIPPIKKITVDRSRLRIVIFTPALVDGRPGEHNFGDILGHVRRWLDGPAEHPLILYGCDRVELYELPEGWQSNQEDESSLPDDEPPLPSGYPLMGGP